MIVFVIIGLAVVVAIGIAWSRVALGRSERRSMENYGRALDVLGDVARRSDSRAQVRAVRDDEEPRSHVRSEPERTTVAEPPAEAPRPRVSPPPRVEWSRPAGSGRARIEGGAPSFEDDSDAFDRERAASDGGDSPPLAPVGFDRIPPTRRAGFPAPLRLAAAIVVAVVVLGGVTTLAIALTRSPGRSRASNTTAAPTTAAGGGGATSSTSAPATSVTSTTQSDVLTPESTSATEVSFTQPASPYTLTFSATGGTCWIGVQEQAGGAYVWQNALYTGQKASYTANGPVVVRLGAPRYVTMDVNGVPADLPANVQPYDVTFSSG